VNDPNIRNRDSQIVEKNYFAFDLDCRNLIAKELDIPPEQVTDSEILKIADDFVNFMKGKEF